MKRHDDTDTDTRCLFLLFLLHILFLSPFTLTRACTPGRNANLVPGAPKITFRESALFSLLSSLFFFSLPYLF